MASLFQNYPFPSHKISPRDIHVLSRWAVKSSYRKTINLAEGEDGVKSEGLSTSETYRYDV
jgi:hypothetical protein